MSEKLKTDADKSPLDQQSLPVASPAPAPAPAAPAASTEPWPESLIITESQLRRLNPAQRQQFRDLNGTVTSDPQ